VTEVPIGPALGVKTCVALVTVIVAEAESRLSSVAVTVWAPRPEDGTMNVAVKAPAPFVVTTVGVVACVAPLNVKVITEVLAKPVPVTITLVPTGPEAGFKVMDAVTIIVVVPELGALFPSPL
jgi:hypothetical protein